MCLDLFLVRLTADVRIVWVLRDLCRQVEVVVEYICLVWQHCTECTVLLLDSINCWGMAASSFCCRKQPARRIGLQLSVFYVLNKSTTNATLTWLCPEYQSMCPAAVQSYQASANGIASHVCIAAQDHANSSHILDKKRALRAACQDLSRLVALPYHTPISILQKLTENAQESRWKLTAVDQVN